MSITAQGGILGYALQVGKGTIPAAPAWYRHKALSVAMGAVTEKEVAPPEIGGINNPTGAYKSGSFYAGRATILPRLEDDIGWLLLGLTGHAAAPVDNVNGTFSHVFSQAPTANGGALFIPWMMFRRYIPGIDNSTDMGDMGIDCKISSAQLSIPQVGPAALDFDVTGRIPSLDTNADPAEGWTWQGGYEDFDSVPMSMKGAFRMPSFEAAPQPATGARLSFINNTTTVREERILGSYHPDDFATRQRVLQVEWTYKWRDPALCRFIFNGGDLTNGDFVPCIDMTDMEVTIESPCPIDPGTIDVPWKMIVTAPKMDWREAGPITLAGDEILQQTYVGTALEADTGLPEDYYKIELVNTRATQYTIPSS